MATRITPTALAAIRSAAIRAYPDECCGALLGTDGSDADRLITAVAPAGTAVDGMQFRIDASEVCRVEAQAVREGTTVLGFYHSHPDATVRPSRTDRDGAWPWYTYIIVAAPLGIEVAAWRLVDDRSGFVRESLEEES
ncbi:MAG: M67 family metallopeptidase [Gemmatimonadaceae bacterium]|nr:M67 family metallopeptidase [Gemmatimonadaceae bacterium]